MRPSELLPRRGEVWLVQFNPSVDAEIQKVRPAVVVNIPNVGRLPLRIVVPLTDWKATYERFPWFVRIPETPGNGLTKESGADTFQVKSVATARFVAQMGTVTDQELDRIVVAITVCIGSNPTPRPTP